MAKNLPVELIILGGMDNSPFFSFLILVSKKNIYYVFIQEKKLQKQQVIGEMRKVFYSERYKASINRKHAMLDKKWNTISNYFENLSSMMLFPVYASFSYL